MRELALNNSRLDGRYDIREQLGRGSYAEIYLARDILASAQSPHRDVVIKALNVFLQDDLDEDLERTLVENFQIEAVALDRVRHPNIISRLGHGTARDLRGTVFHYLLLEYLSGGDLQTLLRRGEVRLPRLLNYIEQICAGLGPAHKYSIIHRDIKPQNLLLTADHSTVKIADFGVARVTTGDSPITRVGTNVYAPPEHSPMFAGKTGTLTFAGLTPAADIYSLAKTVYTMLTRETPRAFAHNQITELPEACRKEKWADELLRVLKKATHEDPRERHQSAEDFWADLAAVRQIAADGEVSKLVTAEFAAPQAHISKGYSPKAPERPSFDEIAGVPSAVPPTANTARVTALKENGGPPAIDDNRFQPPPVRQIDEVRPPQIIVERPSESAVRSRHFRRAAVFLVSAVLFVGILYGTASYMRGRGVLPEVRNPFKQQTAVANTDIYLRPAPNTDNEPIGLVTKNSKVRIVKSQNNWYQVDVIEQGRIRPNQPTTPRGWLNGSYLELSK